MTIFTKRKKLGMNELSLGQINKLQKRASLKQEKKKTELSTSTKTVDPTMNDSDYPLF